MLGRKMVLLAGFLGTAALVLAAVRVFAFPDRPKEEIEEGVRRTVAQRVAQPVAQAADGPKAVIESPVKEAIAGAADSVTPKERVPAKPKEKALDVGKRVLERKTEELLSVATGANQPPTDVSHNPKVQPGKVRWHANLEAAREASARTGKPVLLFHLMGKLDDQFC